MNQKEKINQRVIRSNDTLISALKIMDQTGFRSLLVLNSDDLFVGILTIGNIQRAIIKNIPLETIVEKNIRLNPQIATEDTPIDLIKDKMLQYRMEFMPVVDTNKKIKQVYFWEQLFIEEKLPPKNSFNLPVVIMAGGFGTRLSPLTNVLPKPLIPVPDKTILEKIFERFSKYGSNNFFISVNYKADLIEYYIKQLSLPYKLNFFREEKPSGTAGSLSLLKKQISQPFFVTNCDILIEQDYSEILEYHRSNNNEITLVAALKHFPIPYGTIETGENGRLISLKEKPELTYKINSGMYILEPHLLNEIPENEMFHITQLIENLRSQDRKIGVFPVSENSWVDIGEWSELKKKLF